MRYFDVLQNLESIPDQSWLFSKLKKGGLRNEKQISVCFFSIHPVTQRYHGSGAD
jgi:hypothetical protein